MQEVAPCPLQNPAWQGSHFVLFAVAKKPAKQGEQTWLLLLILTEPSGHLLHSGEAIPLYLPAWQVKQTDLSGLE